MTADCLPIALARTDGEPAVAVLHAGWRGLLAGIVRAGAETLGGRLQAAVGPAIGPCCYEVGDEVSEPFASAFGADVVRGGKLDLWSAAERALNAAGVDDVLRTDRPLHVLQPRSVLLAPPHGQAARRPGSDRACRLTPSGRT